MASATNTMVNIANTNVWIAPENKSRYACNAAGHIRVATFGSNPYFSDRPAILTIQCEEGLPAFPTINFKEGEIILGRDTKYQIIDVIEHGGNSPKAMKLKHGDDEFDYFGVEIIIKMLK